MFHVSRSVYKVTETTPQGFGRLRPFLQCCVCRGKEEVATTVSIPPVYCNEVRGRVG